MEPKSWMRKSVMYNGKNRPHLYGQILAVTEENGKSVAFRHNGVIEWCAKDALILCEDYGNKSDVVSASEALTATIETEIKALTERLEELRTTLKVIKSL